MSHKNTWGYLKQFKQYTERIKQGWWLWVLDKYNTHHTIRHEEKTVQKIQMRNNMIIITLNQTHTKL